MTLSVPELEGPAGEQSMMFNLAFVVGRAASHQGSDEWFLLLSLLACYAWRCQYSCFKAFPSVTQASA